MDAQSIDNLRDALAQALRAYRQLRPQLFIALLELQITPGGPWKITYKRDPAEGDPSIPPKVQTQASVKADMKLDDLPGVKFLNLATVFHMPETFAPFHDFTITKDEILVAPESVAAGIGLRIGLILDAMLKAAKTFAGSAHAVREAVREGRITSDARPILALDERFPFFPYWPRFTADKSIYDSELAKEAPLLDAAEMAIAMLRGAQEEASKASPASANTKTAEAISEFTPIQHADAACHYLDELIHSLVADGWRFSDSLELRKNVSDHVTSLGLSSPFPDPEMVETDNEHNVWIVIHDPVTKSNARRLILTIYKNVPLNNLRHYPMKSEEQTHFRAFAERLKREIRRRVAAAYPPAPTQFPLPPIPGKPAMSKKAKALAALADHPDWTDEQIAQAAGCHVKSLYRWEDYARARELLREGRGNTIRGSKDGKTGDVEAWDEDEFDDDEE